ncbi:mucin-19-like [Anopheles albimanus]|uniref:mucin-19-like n=1 Tax=Anopheles albimanus TaxID=7167 RepID=UPI00163F3EBA|nr:mucin-19-like [Anopheles albimanus]XP_035786136.1 mucin-19-like [Anopheles albimanus]
MAVFLVNVCKFNQCGLTFPSLPDLIQHIESTHIGQKLPDIDEPSQSICLPFSYVQRYVPVDNRREINALAVANPAGNSTDQSNTTEGIGTANPTSVQSVTPVSTANTASNLPSSPEDHAGIQPGPSAGGSGNSSAGIGTGGARNSTDLSGGCTGGSGGTGSSGPSSSSTGTNGAAPTASESPSKASAAGNSQNSGDLKRRMAVKTHHTYSMSSSNRSTTPTGSEMDDDDMMGSESEDSNDSWTTEEFSSEFIMRYGSRRVSTSGGHGINVANEKPFACPVPGCKKRYKNVNGIKYHSKNGHKKDGNRVRKGFKCFCGKSYKTSVRLRNHNLIAHPQGSSGDSIMTTAQPPAPTTSQPALAAASSGSPVLYATGIPVSLTLSQAAPFATNSGGAGGHKPTSPHSNHHVPAVNSSSQISRNATSPTAVTITQQPSNKIARTTNSASSTTTTATTAVAASGTAVAVASTIASSLSGTSTGSTAAGANISSSVGSCNGLPTMGGGAGFPSSTIMHTVAAGGSSIKYDNLGILTPATSPKLIAGVNADSSGGSHAHSTNPSHLGVAVAATNGGGTSPTQLGSGAASSSGSVSTMANSTTAPTSAGPGGGQLTPVGTNGGPSPTGGGTGDGPALCDGGVDGTLGIALVVSNMVGEQLNINGGNGNVSSSSGTGGNAGGGGAVLLSASPATSQLYGEGT